jgi:DtxR family Mn-dependent transcriptional regulator
MPQEQVEEYLETIYDLESRDGSAKTTAIAKCMKIAPASVTEVLKSLSDKGFVQYEPYRGATLTEEGKQIAGTIKRKHRLLEVFLTDVLKLNREKVHDEACRMEHTISVETEDALCRMLDAPAHCPHGSPISPCNKGVGSCAECDGAGNAGASFVIRNK